MGTVHHHSVIATTWQKETIDTIKEWVASIQKPELEYCPNPQSMFLFGPQICNGEATIVLVPDGSKEGWSQSKWGDELRASFKEKLKQLYDEGLYSKWIEVGYGENGQEILESNV